MENIKKIVPFVLLKDIEFLSYLIGTVKESPGQNPEHSVRIQVESLETKLDYMGSSILMGRISNLSAEGKDEWSVDLKQQEDTQPLATRRLTLMFL